MKFSSDSSVCVPSREMLDSASSQTSSAENIYPAAKEIEPLPPVDERAKMLSGPPSCHTSSSFSSSPLATPSNPHSAASGDVSTLSSEPVCCQSAVGVPVLAQNTEEEVKNSSQTNNPSARTDSSTENNKGLSQSKPGSRGHERQSSFERERDRTYSDYSRERERHYRDRSPPRESHSDRHRYRRDYRGHHRSYRDRFPPPEHSYKDWDLDRRKERIGFHSWEHPRERRSYHYSHYHHRFDVSHERRGYYPHLQQSHSHWKWQKDGREPWATKDKKNGWDRDCYQSQDRSSSPAATALESNRSKVSPPRDCLDSAHRRVDQSAKLKKERDDSSEGRRSKKHKKSKKKKKSKDKDRLYESR